MPVMAGFGLTELERKLLRLALCESAQPGEVLTTREKAHRILARPRR
jgi:hypothetical protein